MEGVGGGGAQPCDLIPRLHLELEPMGGRWRGLEEEVVEPSPVISSFSLSRLCRLSLQHNTHQPLKQHCTKGKQKFRDITWNVAGKRDAIWKISWNILFSRFISCYITEFWITFGLWDIESCGSVFLKSIGKVYLVIGSPYKPWSLVFLYTVPKVIDFPKNNMECSGENELIHGIFRVVSRFPLLSRKFGFLFGECMYCQQKDSMELFPWLFSWLKEKYTYCTPVVITLVI